MSTRNEFFERNGYLPLKRLISNPEALYQPFPIDDEGNRKFGLIEYRSRGRIVTYPDEANQVSGSYSRYHYPFYKELHYQLKPVLEMALGIDLLPTYFFDRFYGVGQVLERHIDRPSCEISVSLQVSTNCDKQWPLWFLRPDGSEASVVMNDGDGVIYKGHDIEHWRDALPSRHGRRGRLWNKIRRRSDDTYHHQIFLHYVNAQGRYVEFANDSPC